MSTNQSLADFSSDGLNIGKDHKVLTYLHGLSDFWSFVFEDASKVNLLMEANAVTASDIYNKFLQLSSILSLEDISALTNSQVKLVILSNASNAGVTSPTEGLVPNTVETYYLPAGTPVKYAKFLTNRAFMPTALLENEADYFLDEVAGTVSFAKPLASLGFPTRTRSDGVQEFALWAVDAKTDNGLIYDHYAKVLGVSPTSSSETFKTFIYGMYYLYVNGPDLQVLKMGLNMALGIPLARDVETVLDIRKYLDTDEWLVITDLNSYLVPYGLAPSVAIGDQLSVGQEVAAWVEVKDYVNDGEWWLNFMLPKSLMPDMPPSVPGGGGVSASPTPNRYMVAGSYPDWIMRNYLKTNTFLVNVKTVGFKNIQNFEELAQIIKDVKPAYATPIYVWTVPLTDEIVTVIESLKYSLTVSRCVPITDGISRFHRGNTTDPLSRDCCGSFTRMSAPARLDDILGLTSELNGVPRSLNGGTVSAYIAPQRTYSTLSGRDQAWLSTFRTRGQDQYIPTKMSLDFFRTTPYSADGAGVHPYLTTYPGYRLVALHTTTMAEVQDKFAFAGAQFSGGYMIDLFRPTVVSDGIDVHAVDGSYENTYYSFLINNFTYFFTKGYKGQGLESMFPQDSYKTFLPPVGDVLQSDFLVFVRILSNTYGVYWATKNFRTPTQPYFRHSEPDVLAMTVTGKVTRGMAPMGSPYYLLRSSNFQVSYNTGSELDARPVNDSLDPSTNISTSYSDNFNPSFTMDRSGRGLVTQRVWK